MSQFNDLMISGSSLEKRKLYRRAAEQGISFSYAR